MKSPTAPRGPSGVTNDWKKWNWKPSIDESSSRCAHVAVTSVASSHNFGSPRAVTAKGSSRRSLDPDARRSLDGDLQRAEDGEKKDPSMATI